MAYDMRNDLQETLVSKEEIAATVARLGAEISRDYEGKNPILITVLKGAFIFMADLCRAISVPCEIGFMAAKSYYSGTTSSGVVKITMDLDQDISNYHVIIVEDIIDTGRTIKEVVEVLQDRSPLSLEVITLVDKPECRMVEFKPDKALFTVGDVYVIGCGMDCGEHYRNLPYLAEYDRS